MATCTAVELTILEVCKETDNKVRWDAAVDNARFKLYIPKWRVPSPWPETIRVTVSPVPDDFYDVDSTITPEEVAEDSSIRCVPIEAVVQKTYDCKETVRYDPVGCNAKDWEIGSPYIPHLLTHDKATRLKLTVDWR